jgi:hypothetical protein
MRACLQRQLSGSNLDIPQNKKYHKIRRHKWVANTLGPKKNFFYKKNISWPVKWYSKFLISVSTASIRARQSTKMINCTMYIVIRGQGVWILTTLCHVTGLFGHSQKQLLGKHCSLSEEANPLLCSYSTSKLNQLFLIFHVSLNLSEEKLK